MVCWLLRSSSPFSTHSHIISHSTRSSTCGDALVPESVLCLAILFVAQPNTRLTTDSLSALASLPQFLPTLLDLEKRLDLSALYLAFFPHAISVAGFLSESSVNIIAHLKLTEPIVSGSVRMERERKRGRRGDDLVSSCRIVFLERENPNNSTAGVTSVTRLLSSLLFYLSHTRTLTLSYTLALNSDSCRCRGRPEPTAQGGDDSQVPEPLLERACDAEPVPHRQARREEPQGG